MLQKKCKKKKKKKHKTDVLFSDSNFATSALLIAKVVLTACSEYKQMGKIKNTVVHCVCDCY